MHPFELCGEGFEQFSLSRVETALAVGSLDLRRVLLCETAWHLEMSQGCGIRDWASYLLWKKSMF